MSLPTTSVSSLQTSNRPSTSCDSITESDSQNTTSEGALQDSDREYPIKRIIKESRDKYLIAWEGPYEPTWVS